MLFVNQTGTEPNFINQFCRIDRILITRLSVWCLSLIIQLQNRAHLVEGEYIICGRELRVDSTASALCLEN